LGDDQGEKNQGDERLGDSFSGGGFHALASLVPRARAMTV
jgi:hypothetical protein